ncbi:acyltransferase [Vogesella fluminis]|uniref:Transferase n=1 Tax=Vogesella fluminis TaxID=1069161 RepID=A0ABQ3HA43_9NEIS|nr:acyltransferase [Vogesella fluminis]GHD78411.1 transferase [Vogesella fluminis]
MAWLSATQLSTMGFASIGENVLVSDKASIYNPQNISIGNNVRIDDFCIISAGHGGVSIGNYVHVAAYSSLIGSGKISLSDYSGLSSRVSIYSSNDDYTGDRMTNPTVPPKYTGVISADVFIGKHVIIGNGSIILPGISLNDGSVIAALSLVNKDCEPFKIYGGVPAKPLKERKKNLLDLEVQFLEDKKNKT